MARKCLTIVVVCLLASSVAAQVLADKKMTLEEPALVSKGFSHLERMLQIEAEPEPEPKEPAGASCSPAALTERSDCAAPVPAADQPAPSTSTASKPGVQQPTCTGPDCLVAPMPGELGAPTRPAGEAATQAPLTRPMTYGPMTSAAFDRMVAKKRAAVRAKVEAAGGMDGVLRTFMEVRADPFKEVAAQKVPRHASDEAGIPLPLAAAASGASGVKEPAGVKADFEMRFAAEAPAMAPINDEEAVLADEAAARSHTPAAAGRAWGTSEANLKKQMQQQATAQQAAQQLPKGPGRPPMTEEEAAKLAVQAAAREAGLGRKKLAAQAGRPVDRQAALSAAMQAKQSAKPTALPTRTEQQQGRPMRGMTTSSAGASGAAAATGAKGGAADYKTMPSASRSGFAGRGPREPRIDVEFHTMPGASRPASELPDAERVPESLLRPKPQPQQQPEETPATTTAAAPQHVRSDIERVLLLEQPAAAAAAAAAAVEEPKEPAPKEPAAKAKGKAGRKPSARMSQAVYSLQQRIKDDQAAQARSWAAFDYACAALLLMVAPVAMFLAAAVLEDMFLKPAASSSSSSCAASCATSSSSSAAAAPNWAELPLRWAELTASLWRRTRRAAAVALKSMSGANGGGQLPTCSHGGAAGAFEPTSHATGVADATVRRRH